MPALTPQTTACGVANECRSPSVGCALQAALWGALSATPHSLSPSDPRDGGDEVWRRELLGQNGEIPFL